MEKLVVEEGTENSTTEEVLEDAVTDSGSAEQPDEVLAS